LIKNRKSCSVVDVIPSGADAVMAEKLAVVVPTNPVDIFTNCFRKYACSSAELKPST
jgi:malate/lactate dehydrogenase